MSNYTVTASIADPYDGQTDAANLLINGPLDVRLRDFRQLVVNWEQAQVLSSTELKFIYRNWNNEFSPRFLVNETEVSSGEWNINFEKGTVTIPSGSALGSTHIVRAQYCFNYFPGAVLDTLLEVTLHEINSSSSPIREYDLSGAPGNWHAALVEGTFLKCINQLLFDSVLFQNAYIFSTIDSDAALSRLREVGDQVSQRYEQMLEALAQEKGVLPPTDLYDTFLARGPLGHYGAYGPFSSLGRRVSAIMGAHGVSARLI